MFTLTSRCGAAGDKPRTIAIDSTLESLAADQATRAAWPQTSPAPPTVVDTRAGSAAVLRPILPALLALLR